MNENPLLLKDCLELSRTELHIFLTSLLRKAYTNKSNNIVNGYNNIYDMTIKMKSVDVKPSTYIDLGLKYTEEDPTFEVKHHVRTWK